MARYIADPLAIIPTRGAPDWAKQANPYQFPAHDGWTDFCHESLCAGDRIWDCRLPVNHAGPHMTTVRRENRGQRGYRKLQRVFWTTPNQWEQYDADGRLTSSE